MPSFDLGAYLQSAPKRRRCRPPMSPSRSSSRSLDQVMSSTSIDDLKTYLRWHVLHGQTSVMPEGVRRGDVRVLRQAADRREGAAAAVETLRRRDQQRPRRSAGQGLRRADVRPGRQGAHARGWSRRSRRRSTPTSRRSPGCRTRRRSRPPCKLRAVANKIGYPDRWRDYSSLQHRPRRRARQLAARQHVRLSPPAGQDRQAGRQDRMADDAADGQRLLQPVREQHQLPGRDPAAAVLHQGRRRCGELRRRRRRRRPRADARLRRPGPPVRRRRQPARLVDAGRRQGVRGARDLRGRSVLAATPPSPT